MKRTHIQNLLLVALMPLHGVCAGEISKSPVWYDSGLSFDERISALMEEMTLEEKASQLLNSSQAIERLDISAYDWWSEALHGVARSGKATVFPQAIGLGATFDPGLMLDIGTAISDEARAINHDLLSRGREYIRYMGLSFWSPNVNIFRDPRWGRGQETYGEDPLLSGSLGSAFIRGMQGDDPLYLKTATCAKHFAVHSGPEALRHEFNAVVSDKDLYETYLPAFKMCVDAGVEAVMCAYNRTNDEPCCGSSRLLIDILRKGWGFEGHIVSDCGALRNFHQTHKVTPSPEESAAMAVRSGVDINCGTTYSSLLDAIEIGLITEAEIDARLEKVLMTRFRLGMFDDPDKHPYGDISPTSINTEAHRNLALKAAEKSIVLLQNQNNVLPLKKDLSFVYMGGPFTADIRSLYGNYNGLNDNMVTLLEGVLSKTSPSTRHQYRSGSLVADPNRNSKDWFSGLAKEADATIVGLGLTILLEGEEGEAIASSDIGDNVSMSLPEAQMQYLRTMSESKNKTGKPLIAVLFAGCPLDLREICELADAVIYAWYPGQEGGQALANIIFGEVSPSGKLPVTFPRSAEDLPPYEDYSMEGRTYKYMEKEPLFPFGFGLSYTEIDFAQPKADRSTLSTGQTVVVSVQVENKGNLAAEEVVQLYASYPDAPVRVPKAELKTFRRIYLDAGEAESVDFQLSHQAFVYVDENGLTLPYTGKVILSVGNASPGARSVELGADLATIELTLR